MSGTSATTRTAAHRAASSDWLERAARVGYAVNGVVHLLIAWIAAQIALRGGSGGHEASAGGALEQLSSQPFGAVLVWTAVVGFAGLALLHALEGALGGRGAAEQEASDRLKHAGKAVTYAVLAVIAVRAATGSGSGGGGGTESFTARLMSAPLGQLLVGAVGLGVVAVGAYHVVKGWKRRFLRDLERTGEGSVGTAVVRLGQVGYVAKGVALAVVGALFVTAAVQHDPQEAGGLDEALRTIAQQPFGVALLLVVAAGLAAFGVYCFARARYARV